MDGVSAASGIAGLITLALQVSGTIAIYVKSIRERSKNVQELHDELLLLGEVLSGLRDFLASEQAKGRSFDNNSVLQKAITDCRDRIERIGDKLKPPDNSTRVSRALDKLRWPFEQREVNQMIENLRRYGQTFHFAVTIEGCNLLSKTSEDATKGLREMLGVSKKISELSAQMGLSAEESSKRASQIQQIMALIPMLAKTAVDMNELSHAARLAEVREQEKRITDILDWLAPVSWLHKHRDLQVKRAKGTGEWFLHHQVFKDWAGDDAAEHDLLCVGGPGAGKSILCSLAVDHLRARYQDKEVAVAYYYYDYSDQQLQSPVNLARSLLRQLSSNRHLVPSSVTEFYERTRNDIKDETWFQDLLGILRRVAATFTRFLILVDALDEADIRSQRSGLFEVLSALRSPSGTRVQVMATMRSHVLSVATRFHNAVTMDVTADLGDLRLFLTQVIGEHPDSVDTLDGDLRKQVLNTLCDNANGMFLLPALQIRTILDQITKSDVRRALSRLSTNLNEAFQSTIQRIRNLPKTRRDLALNALMWISHARRPFRPLELQQAMALRLDDADLDRDNFPPIITIIDCCCGLVEVDHESSIIRLVHHSLEEYLRDHNHGLFEDANLYITRICLRYLKLESLRELPFKNRHDFALVLEDMPFLEYAALEWGHHAYDVPTGRFGGLALSLLSDSLALITSARVRDHHNVDFRRWKEKAWAWAYSGGAGILIAAAFGLTELLKVLINENKDNLCLDARNMYGSTPLHEAALHGHESAAEVLIEHGADLVDVDYGSATPLFLAVSYGKLSMVRLLLEHGGPQLETPGPQGLSTLHKAAEQGNEEMVTTLLRAGALVAARDMYGMTALHFAARRGYLGIARLLVQAGAFVHVKDNDGLCPLDYAATGGYTDLVAYLLENGGNMWHKGREAWTPLHRAARGGHTQTVSMFLDRAADVLTADFKGNIPLHLAVRSGNMATVRVLLEHNPDFKRDQLFTRDKKGSTPRVVAFYTAHYDIHRNLRAAEWAVSGTEPGEASILTSAIERGDLSAVRAHLNIHQDSLHMLDVDGQPPLHVALQEDRRAIIDLLLERGASIESVGYHGWRPLHIAASLGNLDLVNLCLTHGASVESLTLTSQTPLHKAASGNSAAVVRRLIEAGADPNDRNDRGMTTLHIAAHQNDIQTVRMLVLEYEMDVLTRDRHKLTPAVWAERSGHLEVMAFLRGEMKKAKTVKKIRGDDQKISGGDEHMQMQMQMQEVESALSDPDVDDDPNPS
ncbi:hypothetical protein LTR34_000569 [Exophiala xenobiotica]|nr:hypothetical protein LTR34_000569 [Exophiala xenobiotica]